MELDLDFGHPRIVLLALRLFGLQISSRFISGRLVRLSLLLGLGNLALEGLELSDANCVIQNTILEFVLILNNLSLIDI